MAFRLRDDEPAIHGLVRIALEQIDRSLADVVDPKLPRPDAVHEVRKRCKKIRGLLRLVRMALADVYRSENDWFRDASAKLANVRAADAMKLALDSLRSEEGQPVADAVLDRLQGALARCCSAPTESESTIEGKLAGFVHAMQVARHRIEGWPEDRIAADETREAILDGFRRTYRRSRRALKTALRVQADEYLHEFRKWAKYHWHQVNLLERLSPKKLRRRAQRLAELSDLLGDDRDLGALRRTLLEQVKQAERAGGEHPFTGHADEVDEVVAAIDERRGRLRAEAFPLAQELYEEKPKAYARWLDKRWKFPAA
jgi:CHAD domain-containing protein